MPELNPNLPAPQWPRALRWKLAWLLLIKLGLLTLLWALCFSPPHRIAVDAEATGNRLGFAPEKTRD